MIIFMLKISSSLFVSYVWSILPNHFCFFWSIRILPYFPHVHQTNHRFCESLSCQSGYLARPSRAQPHSLLSFFSWKSEHKFLLHFFSSFYPFSSVLPADSSSSRYCLYSRVRRFMWLSDNGERPFSNTHRLSPKWFPLLLNIFICSWQEKNSYTPSILSLEIYSEVV